MKGPNLIEPTDGAIVGEARRGGFLAKVRYVMLLVLVMTVAFFGGFAAFASYVAALTTPADPEPADAIIVLTGGQARIDAAVALLKSGKGERLLISGVHPSADRDDLAEATGGDQTLFACCVDIGYDALDTVGNAEESAQWITSHGYRSAILVTNNYHMPRSLLEMGRLVGDTRLDPYPVVNSDLSDWRWLSQPDARRILFTEYLKYIASFAGLSPRVDPQHFTGARAAP